MPTFKEYFRATILSGCGSWMWTGKDARKNFPSEQFSVYYFRWILPVTSGVSALTPSQLLQPPVHCPDQKPAAPSRQTLSREAVEELNRLLRP